MLEIWWKVCPIISTLCSGLIGLYLTLVELKWKRAYVSMKLKEETFESQMSFFGATSPWFW